MSFFQSIVLGIVQGLTEFLPISSDGHLALTFKLFGMTPDLSFEIFLHFATLIAILAYFWRDIIWLASALLPENRHRVGDRRIVALIVIGTFVSGVLALLLKPVIEPASDSFIWIGAGFLFTCTIMVIGESLGKFAQRKARPTKDHHMHPGIHETDAPVAQLPLWKAIPIGFLQGVAVLPGVSRSGSTIASGMLSGLKRDDAARFSFLLGIPIITMATMVDGIDFFQGTSTLPSWPVAIAGFVAAGVSGYLAIWWLLRLVRKTSLYWFAAYTGVLGTVILVLGLQGRG